MDDGLCSKISWVDEFFPEGLLIFMDMRPSMEKILLFSGSSRSSSLAIAGTGGAGGIVLFGLAQAARKIISSKNKVLRINPVIHFLP
jgi:hypothetical protein